jgi:cobalt-zinc-cadmium efflux system outer membrane protein
MRTERIAAVLLAALACGVASSAAAPAAAAAVAPAVAPADAPADAQTLSLDAAVAQALERAPQLLIARANLEASAAAARQSRWPENPELEVETENVLGSGPFSDFDAAETTVTLRQPVTVGGKRSARVAAARARFEQARAELELAQRATRRDVTIGYANAIMAERLAVLARARSVDAQALRAASERRLAAGALSELQYAQAVLAGAEAAAALNRAQADAANARRALARWLGTSDPDGVSARFDDSWFDQATAGDELSGRAVLDDHPRLRAQRAALAAAMAQQRLEERGAIPDPVLSLGARRFGDAPAGENRALVLGVSLPLPLWDRNTAERASARRERVIAETGLDAAQRELADELALARSAHAAATGELRALNESAAPAARSAAALTQRGFDAGRLSLADRLAADQALQSTEAALQRARFALHQSRAQLEYLQAAPMAAAP